MRGHRPHLGGTPLQQDLGSTADGAATVDHVVGQDAQAAVDIADHFLGLGDVVGALRPALVDEGQVGALVGQVLGHALGHLDAAGIWRHDDRVLGVLADVGLEHRHGREVIDGAVEEALDLTAVQVDGHHALGAGGLEQVGDEACRDGLAALGLAVLTGISVERAHGGDALGGSAVGSVDHDELFHDRVVDAAAVAAVVGLHDEHIGATDALAETRSHLAVGELDQVGVAQLDVQMLGHLLGKRRMRSTGVERHALGGDLLHCGGSVVRLRRRVQCRTHRS